ncbi:MAG: hypothetical protein GY788_07555 [bacterium]|nr:hypothetical protein [bacterium]
MADRYWVNDNANGLWADADNWATTSGGSGGAGFPTSSDDVYFDSGSTDDCNHTSGSPAAADIFTMESSYTGTFTLSRSITLEGAATVSGIISITANGFTVKGNITIKNGGSITHSSGPCIIGGISYLIETGGSHVVGDLTTCNYGATGFTLIVESGGTLGGAGEIKFDRRDFGISGVIDKDLTCPLTLAGYDCTLLGDTTVNGISFDDADLTIVLDDYDLTIKGDVAFAGGWTKGTGLITLSGGVDQDIDFNGESVEDIEIDKLAGSVTLTGNVTTDSLTGTDGTLDIDGNNLETTGNFTAAAGAVFNDTTGGGLVTVGGNFDLNGISGTPITWDGPDLDITGTADADWTVASDSNASAGTAIDATDNCTDGTGNTNWTFSGGPQTVQVGLPSVSNTALAVSVAKQLGVVQAVESELSYPVTARRAVAAAVASETDSALASSGAKTAVMGLSSEATQALPVLAISAITLELAEETSAALSPSVLKAALMGLSQEADVALAAEAVLQQLVAAAVATEAVVALPVIATKQSAAGLATEADQAVVLAIPKTLAVGLASEVGQALAAGALSTVPVLQAVETGAAQTIDWSRALRPGIAAETETAFAVTVEGAVIVYAEGLEYEVPENRLHYTLPESKIHYTLN